MLIQNAWNLERLHVEVQVFKQIDSIYFYLAKPMKKIVEIVLMTCLYFLEKS